MKFSLSRSAHALGIWGAAMGAAWLIETQVVTLCCTVARWSA